MKSCHSVWVALFAQKLVKNYQQFSNRTAKVSWNQGGVFVAMMKMVLHVHYWITNNWMTHANCSGVIYHSAIAHPCLLAFSSILAEINHWCYQDTTSVRPMSSPGRTLLARVAYYPTTCTILLFSCKYCHSALLECSCTVWWLLATVGTMPAYCPVVSASSISKHRCTCPLSFCWVSVSAFAEGESAVNRRSWLKLIASNTLVSHSQITLRQKKSIHVKGVEVEIMKHVMACGAFHVIYYLLYTGELSYQTTNSP